MIKTRYNQRSRFMPLVKIGPKHQITIPKIIFDDFELKVGDMLEIMAHEGRISIFPKQLSEKLPVSKFSDKEQLLLESAKQKISVIKKDMKNSQGLTKSEVEVAAKAGLIDPEQKWWWTEAWQKGEREAEEDIQAGRVSGPFKSADELLKDLES